MLKKITAVFPEDYTNPPTVAEIRKEVKRQIAAAHIIPLDLTEWLESVECPYMREAYALALNEVCAKMEERCLKKVGCVCDGCYKPYWDKREKVIKDMLDEAREQQMELENSVKEEPSAQPAPAPVCSVPTPMPAPASKPELTSISVIINGNAQIFADGSRPVISINA